MRMIRIRPEAAFNEFLMMHVMMMMMMRDVSLMVMVMVYGWGGSVIGGMSVSSVAEMRKKKGKKKKTEKGERTLSRKIPRRQSVIRCQRSCPAATVTDVRRVGGDTPA